MLDYFYNGGFLTNARAFMRINRKTITIGMKNDNH